MTSEHTTNTPEESPIEKRRVEQRKIRALEIDSPEGRPPAKRARRASWIVFWLVGLALLAVIIIAVARTNSTTAIVVGAALVILYALATMPVWGATLLRKGEKERMEEQVREDPEVISR